MEKIILKLRLLLLKVSEMSKTDLLVSIQTIQDLLSEYFNMYLCLVDETGQEITLPSGLPLECVDNQFKENSKCQSCTKNLLEKIKNNEKNFTNRCPHGLYVNVSPTMLPLSNNSVFLICGKVKDITILDKHFKIVNSIFSLPLGISKEPSSTSSNTKSNLNLTQQELIILTHIIDGFTNKEIASQLCISLSTVKSHIANIFKKLDVNNRTEAAIIFKSMKEQTRNAIY